MVNFTLWIEDDSPHAILQEEAGALCAAAEFMGADHGTARGCASRRDGEAKQ